MILIEKSPLIFGKTEDIITEPVEYRVQDFDEQSAKEFHQAITEANNTGQTVFPVIIDSYGGDIYSLLSMLDDIENSNIPVATIVNGKAMSCGCFLAGFGTSGYRYAGPHSQLMFHDFSLESEGKANDAINDMEQMKIFRDDMFRKFEDACKMRRGRCKTILKNVNNSDIYLTAEQALKMKIIDHIGVPNLRLNLKAEYSFE